MIEPVILVGLRLEGVPEYRRRNWAFNRARWEQTLGWPIYEGHYNHDPFSLARASNLAAEAAGDWQVAFYVGADFLLADPSQAQAAVDLTMQTDQLVFAHDHLMQMSEAETDALTAGTPVALAASGEHRHPNTYSGALAVTRTLWDVVGGFDNRFVDWGWDDLAFWAACCAIGGDYHRIAGDAFHLWHPRSRAENEENPFHNQNEVLGRRYLAAKDDQAGMFAILREPGGPLATADVIRTLG